MRLRREYYRSSLTPDLLQILDLPQDELVALVEQRHRDESERFAYCRELGQLASAERWESGKELGLVAARVGVDPRLLWLVEEGVLEIQDVPRKLPWDLERELSITLPKIHLDLPETD